MQTITVKRTIKAPIEKVFDLLSDHANYKQFPGVKESKLLREGKPHRNGVGALRRIETPTIWFEEEITAYERPRHFAYKIVKCSLPVEHEGGRIELQSTAEGTAVTWTSTAGLKVPVIGGLLSRFLAPQLGKAFASMLKDTERRLAA
jgi:uncharacterized protein YndB with AHSA1/START domain